MWPCFKGQAFRMSDIDTAPGKRERAKQANRQMILDAGRQVFARLGVESTTVRDIIRETDLASGTFYNYFKSKEEVFHALAAESTKRFRPRLADVRATAPSVVDYVRAAYHAYFAFLRDENDEAIRSGAPHMALIGVRVDTPDMQAVFEEIRRDLEHYLRADSLPHVDVGFLTAAAIGIARELGDHMLRRQPLDVEGASAFASELLLAGIHRAGMAQTD